MPTDNEISTSSEKNNATTQNQSHGLSFVLNLDAEEFSYTPQPTLWWFCSTAFPLIAGTFGPVANLMSVCSLAQPWRENLDGSGIYAPTWIVVANGISLFGALVANILLLLNFAHRVDYSIAQPITIIFWYLSTLLLVIPIGAITSFKPPESFAYSQSYYYAVIAGLTYFAISTLLLLNLLGAVLFKAYPPSFETLTVAQRTLMLQTILYSFYLAFGAGLFAGLENWRFVDGIYWADYTLLTIGFGSDFPFQRVLSRALVIPYSIGGIMFLGLIIGAVRSMVLERGQVRVIRSAMAKERQKWIEAVQTGKETLSTQGDWRKAEFDRMRAIGSQAEQMSKYGALGYSFLAMLIVWIGGSLIFWWSESKNANWTFFDAIYFAYIALVTIGFGDFYPTSHSGRPFFVIWSLISVPAMTILISNLGDTIVYWVKNSTLRLAQRTILPEKRKDEDGLLRDRLLEEAKGNGAVSRVVRGSEQQPESSRRWDEGPQSSRACGTAAEKVDLDGNIDGSQGAETRGEKCHRLMKGKAEAPLCLRLIKEIRRVSKDIGKRNPPKYDWERWRYWLEMLWEKDGGINVGNSAPDVSSSQEGGRNEIMLTWLADNGPLFSSVSEPEWVLSRLCGRLERILADHVPTP